jgi:hypothetical protein
MRFARRLGLLVAVLLGGAVAVHADLRPDSSGVPLFSVYALIKTHADNSTPGQVVHNWAIDRAHPLLAVESVADFYLKNDKRRVRVVLTPDDAKAFAALARQYDQLGLTAGDASALLTTGRGFDGSLTFDDPIAAYLRHRFHIKPGTNDVESLPLSPFAAPGL